MTRFSLLPGLAALMASLALSGSAHAGLIYDSGVPLTSVISGSSSDANPNGPGAHIGSDFTIGAFASVTEVKWDGIYYVSQVPPATDSFSIQFYDFSASMPATVPLFSFAVGNAVHRTDTGLKVPGSSFEIYSFDASIPTASLAAGRYVFSVQDDTTGNPNSFYWTFGASTGHELFGLPSGGVAGRDQTTNFSLLGSQAVPEPSSLVMLGIGAIGLLGYARHRGAKGSAKAV